MRISIIAVGRVKKGPERELFDDYIDRFRKAGRQLGFRSADLIEVDSSGGLDAEADRLLGKIPTGARTVRLDEFGEQFTSTAFSSFLSQERDKGLTDICFLIGGAEGYGAAVREAVPQTMAFGVQTWPHRFVRVMLAEQLYRSASLEAGLPYHKA
ncbi:23S rRNA (pseudouridine(1915)-N(3))-methyltransferase RlmH [Henriciella barbarensis]|uniref:Ribosomal RNA large subunit methyltransferase H n=1 Tax=Henriciella barbarensis TaxID=86342 RepID=A0A399QRH2_9PROT|nr:23S rRNA (pseudouridine(1915)-N(3))-methyltransferase RlmH [Henriciella barbarensis]RIJ21393.1 23S rRNA (pseudouridine(1915)-N(3))-methyltransferase RlmH [Henriciella barbarensis]